MNEKIKYLFVAEITKIDEVIIEKSPNQRLCIVSADYSKDFEKFDTDKNKFSLTISNKDYKIAYETQVMNVLLANEDFGEDFVNVWLRDYCGDFFVGSRTEELKKRIVEFRNPKLLKRESIDKINEWWDDINNKDGKLQEVYLFPSSYGGDGIKLKVLTEKWF